jgi:hypothetical protein
MKITRIAKKNNLNQVMDISVDVHKDTLNFFFASAGKEYTDQNGKWGQENGVKPTVDPYNIKCYILQHVTST